MEIWDFDYDSDNVWIYSESDKAIFKVDMHNNIELLTILDKSVWNSYRGICCYNNRVYMAPQNGVKEIFVYDMVTQIKYSHTINEVYCPKGSQHNLFIEIVRYENKIFLIPGRYEAIICLEPDIGKITYIDGWYHDIKNDLSNDDYNLVIFNGISRINENQLLIIGWKSNISLVFDMNEMKYQIIRFENKGSGLRGAIYNEKDVLLTYKNIEGIYHESIGNNEFSKISDLHGRLYSYNNKVYVVNSVLGKIYKFVNPSTNTYKIVYSSVEQNNAFFLVKQYLNKLIILNSVKDSILIFDMEKDSSIDIDISELESLSVRIKSDENGGFVIEDEQLGLEKFITTL